MTQPSRKTLLVLLRRWFDESRPYPSQELYDATAAVLAPDAVKPEMEGQTAIPCGYQIFRSRPGGWEPEPACEYEAGHAGAHSWKEDDGE